MFKRWISLFTAICLLGTFASFAAFAEEALPTSADGIAVPSQTGIISAEDTSADSAVTRSTASQLQTFDGTNSDGTLDIANGIRTNLIENSSKYNGMAALPIPQTTALSRYSTERIALAPDISDTVYAEAAELLGALGIMVGDAESGAFRPNDSIIRSEMAKVAVYAVGLEDVAQSSVSATRFPDVASDHWATGAINVADTQGMVVGDDVGTFRPDDPVLLQEAVAVIVRAMGYEPAAEDKGGYPSGYMQIASSNQLLRGISGIATQPATRGDIAQLVFNAMTVNLMEQTGFGSNTQYQVVDKTLLYDRLNVEKGYGQITGTYETTLSGGATVDRDRIMIEDSQYLEGDTLASQLLGYNVLYYARIDKTTDEKTLIVVREQENKNKTVRVDSEDIVSVSGTDGEAKTFVYWPDTDANSSKTVSIAPDAVYIYNGKYKASVTNEALKPTSGNVTLLDSDTNGVYETVFVNHFTNLVVDTVSSVTGRVTDKYLNGSLVFDEDNESVLFTLIKDGREIGLADLKEWNIISYTVSDDKALIKGYVSDAVLSGIVTEINNDRYRIGSSEELHRKAANYTNEIALRDRGNFYLDIEGKIAAVDPNAVIDNSQTDGKNYAYLAGAAMNSGFDTTAQFKLFTMKGETVVLNSTSKMRLNDDYSLEPSAVVDTLTATSGGSVGKIIVYEANSNNDISAIETAVDMTSTGAPNVGTFTMNIKRDDMVYKSASGKLGSVGIADSTVIFDIPADAGNDTDKFSVRNKGTLSNETAYDAVVYDLQENYTANVVVITSSVGVTAPESPILVVDYISATQNDDYENTDRVYGWQSGKEIDLLAADKTVLRKGSESLEQGDIIQYRTNAEGEIDGITLLFNIKNKANDAMTEVTEDLTTVYGKVTKKFSGSINMTVNGTVQNFATGDATVYMYDSTRNKPRIEVVSAADIEIFEEGNEARLFVKVYEDAVQEMVIIK